jgi:diaminopimelate epimerase
VSDVLHVSKYQALGNDFLIVDARDDPRLVDDHLFAMGLLDRHFGAGADGLIFVTRSAVADVGMRIRTPSGGWLTMCGNGIRCLARFVRDAGISTAETLRVETDSGVRQTRWLERGDLIEADLLEPDLRAGSIPTTLAREHASVIGTTIRLARGSNLELSCVSVGNPHAVIFVEALDAFDDSLLPEIAQHPAFPEGVNVHAAEVITPERARIRTWERGAGWTLA